MRALRSKLPFIIFINFLLSSCMVGPNFHSPPTPPVYSYTGTALPNSTVQAPAAGQGGKKQYFLIGRDLPSDWWRLFHSTQLNELIRAGIDNSPTIESAKAALLQAQELYYSQFASSFLPNITGQTSANRQRFAEASIGQGTRPASIFNLYNVSASVSYNLDLFGGARRSLEALCAQVNYQRYQLEAAYLTLTSNIVTTAVTLASLKAQIKATKELVMAEENLYHLLNGQFELGAISKVNVLAQQAQLNQTRATLPPLEKDYAQNMHALSVFIGSVPDEKQIPTFDFKNLNLPAQLPLSIPSRLVRQRPDIRAAEALLHAASARIGVATANMYPQLTLNGNYGWEGSLIPSLFTSSTNVWNYGGTLLQTLFDGGALNAQRCAAIDAYKQALAQYKQTVLLGFKNVADVLRALEADAKELKLQKDAEVYSKKSLDLTIAQYKLGSINYLFILNAQRQYEFAQLNRIRAQAKRYNDTAALFQALGGGWWNRHVC